MPINAPIIVSLFVLMLCGCASVPPAFVAVGRTLEGDSRLPGAEIAELCSAKEWEVLRSQEYLSYVILNVVIFEDDSVNVGNVQACYPDALYVPLARALAKTVRLLKVTTTGSRIPPPGEVFVIVFEQGLYGKKVLVYGRQLVEQLPGASVSSKARYISMETY